MVIFNSYVKLPEGKINFFFMPKNPVIHQLLHLVGSRPWRGSTNDRSLGWETEMGSNKRLGVYNGYYIPSGYD